MGFGNILEGVLGGGEQTASSQTQRQGLHEPYANKLSGDTYNLSRWLEPFMTGRAADTTWGARYTNAFDSKATQPFASEVGSRIMGRMDTAPKLNSVGLFDEQMAGFEKAVSQAMAKMSGNFAARGFRSPGNAPAIAGSAAQGVMSQYAPLVSQNKAQVAEDQRSRLQDALGFKTQEENVIMNRLLQALQAALSTEGVQSGRFNDLLKMLQVNQGLIGGAGSSSSSYPGLNTSFQQGLGMTLGQLGGQGTASGISGGLKMLGV
ncbi:MAG: hypothetical protein CV089_02175 [Nitrospira sp. WS110]|nr:hypothetical protein [Nitrospira sp. WS110]